MHKHIKRLGLAFAISLTSLLGTLTWYYAGQRVRQGGAQKDAVARLTESTDEVQRKETTRVIWETIDLNDDLFAGEAIRTSAKASAKVRLKSGAVIHLDPDSLVVLEQNANGLALDFLEGNLFIQGAASAGANGITLKTGQGELTMNSADVSLSRGQGGKVDLEVYRGQLELNQGGKTVALGRDKSATLGPQGMAERRDQLRLTAPVAGETVLLNLARGEKFNVGWSPLPAAYRVSVEIGPTRGRLTAHAAKPFAGADGAAAIDLKPGRYFLRLTARADGQPDLTSLITPFTLAPRTAPALIEPTAAVTRESVDRDVKFQWLDRNRFDAHVVEIASDEAFKKIVQKKNVGAEVDQWAATLPDGTYFWRVTGFSNKIGLSSTPVKFTLSVASGDRAILSAPANHQRLALADVTAKGVVFKWLSTATKDFEIDVRDAKGGVAFHAASADGVARATEFKPGVYTWTVKGEGPSETFDFTVFETPRLTLSTPAGRQEYVTPAPTLQVEWAAVPKATYRYRVGAPDASVPPWTPTTQNKIRVTVPADGAYRVAVEALGPKGEVMAVSEERVIDLHAKPRLTSPRWAGTGAKIKSDGRGNVTLDWDPVDGARAYKLELIDESGKSIERAFDRAPASLTRLRPGQYQIKVRGVDEFNRDGTTGPTRALDVPNASDIRAPKIRAMKVK